MTDNILVFLHQVKTGGMSLITLIEKNIGVRKTFRFFRQLPPFDRWRDLENREEVRFIHGHFPLSFIEKYKDIFFPGREVKYCTFLRNPVDRILSYYYFYKYAGTVEQFLTDKNDAEHKANAMTRVLGDGSLEQAKHNLKSMQFGLTSKFDWSLQVMRREHPYFLYNTKYEKQNVTPDRGSIFDHYGRDIQLIKDANQDDMKLWLFASKEFNKRRKY